MFTYKKKGRIHKKATRDRKRAIVTIQTPTKSEFNSGGSDFIVSQELPTFDFTIYTRLIFLTYKMNSKRVTSTSQRIEGKTLSLSNELPQLM